MSWLTMVGYSLKIVGWIIGRSKASKEQKLEFDRFYKSYNEMGNNSLKQYDDIKKQMEDLKKESE